MSEPNAKRIKCGPSETIMRFFWELEKKLDDKLSNLMVCLENNDVNGCADLLEDRPDLDANALLYYASKLGNRIPIMQLALEKGASAVGKYEYMCPLTNACKYGRLESAAFLLESIKPPQRLALEYNRLLIAVCKGSSPIAQKCKMIEHLVGLGAPLDPQQKPVTPLIAAIEMRDMALIQFLLDLGAKPYCLTTNNESPLHVSCRRIELDVFQLLCHYLPNINWPDARNDTPLSIAVKFANKQALSILLKYKELDLRGILATACSIPESMASTMFHLLRKRGAPVTPFALPISAQAGNHIAKWLLENDASVDVNIEYEGNTALFYACQRGNEEMVKLLLEKGANPNASKTPLLCVVYGQRNNIFKQLLDNKANVNVCMTRSADVRKTLLHCIMDSGNVAKVTELIKAGAVLEDFLEKDSAGGEIRSSIWKYASDYCTPVIQVCIAIPHTPQTHRQFPPFVRRAVVTMLLANRRLNWRLHSSVIHKIFSYEH